MRVHIVNGVKSKEFIKIKIKIKQKTGYVKTI